MKKIILLILSVLIVIGLSAAFLYKNQKNNTYLDKTPKGAETNYQEILKATVAKCGKSIKLLFFVSQLSYNTPPAPINIYGFTAGSCGKNDESFWTYYNDTTKQITVASEELMGLSKNQPLPLSSWVLSAKEAANIAVQKLNSIDIINLQIQKVVLNNNFGESFQWYVYLKQEQGNTIQVAVDPKTGAINNINNNYKSP